MFTVDAYADYATTAIKAIDYATAPVVDGIRAYDREMLGEKEFGRLAQSIAEYRMPENEFTWKGIKYRVGNAAKEYALSHTKADDRKDGQEIAAVNDPTIGVYNYIDVASIVEVVRFTTGRRSDHGLYLHVKVEEQCFVKWRDGGRKWLTEYAVFVPMEYFEKVEVL